MADLQKTMGNVIRQERRERRLTLRDLARLAALSVVYLGEIERGQKYPSARVLEQLAEAMGLDVSDLLEAVAVELRQEREVIAAPIGFVRVKEDKPTPRASIAQPVNMLRPMEVALLGALTTTAMRVPVKLPRG
jgi:transcriptional regulator with XRE-family HTH domain